MHIHLYLPPLPASYLTSRYTWLAPAYVPPSSIRTCRVRCLRNIKRDQKEKESSGRIRRRKTTAVVALRVFRIFTAATPPTPPGRSGTCCHCFPIPPYLFFFPSYTHRAPPAGDHSRLHTSYGPQALLLAQPSPSTPPHRSACRLVPGSGTLSFAAACLLLLLLLRRRPQFSPRLGLEVPDWTICDQTPCGYTPNQPFNPGLVC